MDPQLHGPPWGDRNDYEGSVTEALQELVGVNDNAQEIEVWERGTSGVPFWSWLSMWAMRRYAVCKARERGYDYEGSEVQDFVHVVQAEVSGGAPTEVVSTDERLVLYTYPNDDWLCFERCLPVFEEGTPSLQDHPWCWRQIEDKPSAKRFPLPEKPFDRDESMTLEERVAILCDEHKVTLAECGCKDMIQCGGKWVREAYDAFDRPTGEQAVLACCDCGMPVDPDVDSLKTPAGTWLHLEGCVMPTFDDVKVKDKKRAPEAKVEPSVIVSCEDCEDGCAKCDPFFDQDEHSGADYPGSGPDGFVVEEPAADADPTRGPVQPCPGCSKLTGRRPLCPACTASSGDGAGADHASDGSGSTSEDESSEVAPWDVEEEEKGEPCPACTGRLPCSVSGPCGGSRFVERKPDKRTVHMVRMFDKASVCGRTEARVNRVEQKLATVTCKSCLRMADSELELRKKVNGFESAPTPDTPTDFGRIRMSCHCGRRAIASEEHWPRPVHGIYCDCGDLFVAWPIKLGDSAPSKTADGLESRPAAGKWPCELCSHQAHHHVGYSDDSPLKCVSCDCPAFVQPGEKKSTVCTLCFHTYAWALGHGVANLCEQCAKMNCLIPYEGPAQVERLRTELKAQAKLDAKAGDLTEPDLPPCEVAGCEENAAVRFHRKGKGYPVRDACRVHADDSKVRGRRRAFSEL